MPLSKGDLEKIEKLFDLKTDRILELLNQKADKKDVDELKDMVIQIRNELNTEHTIRYRKLELTEELAKRNEKEIEILRRIVNDEKKV